MSQPIGSTDENSDSRLEIMTQEEDHYGLIDQEDLLEIVNTAVTPSRFKILEVLVANDELRNQEIADRVSLDDNGGVSHNLMELRKDGLVRSSKQPDIDGRFRYYKATPTAEAIVELVDELLEREQEAADAFAGEGEPAWLADSEDDPDDEFDEAREKSSKDVEEEAVELLAGPSK